MSKAVLIAFSLLTALAGYLTYTDAGADKPSVEQQSVRQGSVGSGARYHGK